MRRMLRIVGFLCGIFVLYDALGGLIGFAVERPHAEELDCRPSSTMGLLEWHCSTSLADRFWAVLVGWPRFLIFVPAVAVAHLHAFAKNGFRYWFYFDEALWYLRDSIPLAIAVGGSFVHWRTRSWAFALGPAAVLLGDILYLGLHLG